MVLFILILRVILYAIFIFSTYVIIMNWKAKEVKKIVLSIIIILLFFVSIYFQYIPIMLFNIDISKLTNIENTLLGLFSNISLLIILITIYFKDLKREFIIFKDNLIVNLEIGFKYWIIGLFIMMASNIIITIFTGGIAANEELVQGMIKQVPILALLSAGIIAPLVEELCFRKSIKDIIKNKYVGSLLSGILFGLLHIAFSCSSYTDFLYVIPYGSLGFVFSMMYYETNTVATSIFMHFLHNSILTILSIISLGFIIW